MNRVRAVLSLIMMAWALVVGPANGAIASSAVATASPVADSGYAHPDWLVDPAWVEEHAADPTVRIVALTPADVFAAGHIPGAAQIDWPDLEVTDTADPSIARWQGEVETRLTALGIAPADTVVIYDDDTLYAARLWWVLEQLGHADKRLLNGGMSAWTATGGALETGPAAVTPAGTPYRGTPNTAVLATLETVKDEFEDPSTILVDARTAQEYVEGHIPGAVHVEFTTNAAATAPKLWKSAAELRALYAAVGVTPDQSVIPYCTTGVRSAVTYFTLRLLGYERVALFTGSWAEWSSHPELPKTAGNEP